jgi:murein DD-endopeptidase MepM/ murein hydrolase activator NlpD
MLGLVRRFGIVVGAGLVLLSLVLPARATADAPPVVLEVNSPDGTQVVVSGEGALSYPQNGRFVDAASVTVEDGRLVFSRLSLLGGRIMADRLVVPLNANEPATVSGLAVEGERPEALPNQVVPLQDGGYVITLQQSLDAQNRELAGLVVHLGAKTGRLQAGTEILVGVPSAVEPATRYVYPLGEQGEIIGCPFAPGSTHSPFVAPNNLASDNAVDIAVPVGTPVYAVEAGVVGPQIGPLDSTDPHMAGLRVHLDTPGVHFYYAHLSQIDVLPGQYVEAGQQIGLSGSANGAAHLHFAQDVGNPAETVGALGVCPFFQSYAEPWD